MIPGAARDRFWAPISAASPFGWVLSLSGDGDRIAYLDVEDRNMPLVYIVLLLIVVGVGLWVINRYIPMASSIKAILNVVVVIAVCIWVLKAVGVWGDVLNYRIAR